MYIYIYIYKCICLRTLYHYNLCTKYTIKYGGAVTYTHDYAQSSTTAAVVTAPVAVVTAPVAVVTTAVDLCHR